MSKKIRCPHCGHRFEESAWSKAGRCGIYTLECVAKIGTQLAVSHFTRNNGSIIQNGAGKVAEGVTGDINEYTWGDLTCPKCKKNLGNP